LRAWVVLPPAALAAQSAPLAAASQAGTLVLEETFLRAFHAALGTCAAFAALGACVALVRGDGRVPHPKESNPSSSIPRAREVARP
jgi:hypothetical protein